MSATDARLLRLIKAAPSSTEALLQFLLEGLDWPIPETLALEGVPLDWSLDDLHLDPDRVARLRSIKQIPRLVNKQRFGVFILDFEGGALPIGAVRRVVDRLVATARSRKNRGTLPSWALDELLFFCQTAGTERTLHVVALRDNDGRRQVRVSSWSRSAPEARLELVLRRTIPELNWSTNAAGPVIGMNAERQGFHAYRYSIKSADSLARRMAEVARDVRDEVLALYDVETATGPVRMLYEDVRNQLLADLDPQKFADFYAQTMVYGLLAARISHPEEFKHKREDLVLDLQNPLLEALYEEFVSSTSGVLDVDELGLGDLADVLAEIDIDEVLADFGSSNSREDPVVHFYESFLALYDPTQRIELGAFYTPTPIVRCMVGLVDQLLTREFGLADGIDSAMTWEEMECEVEGLQRPAEVAVSDRYFAALDPATGTGTFLVEWLRLMRSGRSARRPSPETESRARGPVGLEVSLPPYSIAQLRLALEERETGTASAPRAAVFLTDTMAGPELSEFLAFEENVIAEQGALADALKASGRSTIVIGNPPYGDKAKGRGAYVEQSWGGRGALLDDFTPEASRGLGAHLKILRNLYVFFWRFAADQAWLTPPSRPGIVSLITSSAWLTGPVFEEMRRFLIAEAKANLWIVDLGGDLISGELGDENVFPIRTPVAIVTAVRPVRPGGVGTVHRLALRGSASSKLDALDGLTLDDPRWVEWTGVPGQPIEDATSDEWQSFPSLGDLMPFSANGVHQQRTWVNDGSRAVLGERWKALVSAQLEAKPLLMKETRSRKASAAGRNLVSGRQLGRLDLETSEAPEEPCRYSFRFLDRQWLIPDSRVIDMPSPGLWSVRSAQQFFLNELHSQQLGPGPGVVVAPYIPNLDHFKGNSGGRILPAYRDAAARVSNVAPGLVEMLSEDFDRPVTGEDVVSYIVGLVSHRGYVAHFAGELKTPGIRIPISRDSSTFGEVADVGRRVIWIQTFGQQYAESQGAADGVPGRLPRIEDWPEIRVSIESGGMPDQIRHDAVARMLYVGGGQIANVPEEVFSYSVSGMPIIRKWLGYRKANPSTRTSSPLNEIVSTEWPAEWTAELVDLLHAVQLLLLVEPRQQSVMDRVIAGETYSVDEITGRIHWPPQSAARKPIG